MLSRKMDHVNRACPVSPTHVSPLSLLEEWQGLHTTLLVLQLRKVWLTGDGQGIISTYSYLRHSLQLKENLRDKITEARKAAYL